MMMMLVLMIMLYQMSIFAVLGYYYGPGDYDSADDQCKGSVVMILVLI